MKLTCPACLHIVEAPGLPFGFRGVCESCGAKLAADFDYSAELEPFFWLVLEGKAA
jgi:uncharacterized paraquat-inducible protein A